MAKILVIDDDDNVRDLIADTLREDGHVVTVACDGKQGMDRFRSDGADLVITDLVMPVREGMEVIIELRKKFPGTRIIAMSGASMRQICLTIAKKLGALRSIDKPFSKNILIDSVNSALNGGP